MSELMKEQETQGIMKWLEVRITAPGEAMEALADFMYELGSAGSVFSEDPQKRPGLQAVTAFLPLDDEIQSRVERLKEHIKIVQKEFPAPDWGGLETWTIEAEDWLAGWKANFKPLQAGDGIWIVPTWLDVPEEARNAVVIRLDPGMAFGTGLHATTRMCIQALAQMIPRLASSMLDIGTGTGILAMIAARLGARRVCGVDLDPAAVQVARENLAQNDLQDKISIKLAGADPRSVIDEKPFELITANLFSEELVRLRPLIIRHLAQEGCLIVSGILKEQAQRVIDAYMASGFRVERRMEEDEWVTMLLRRN